MLGFPGGSVVKNLPTNVSRRRRKHGFDPGAEKIPWRRKWQPTPVLLPGKYHGQRSRQATTVHETARIGHKLVIKLPPMRC